MNSIERIDSTIKFKPTDKIPVAPLIIGFAAKCAGYTQREIYSDFNKWLEALEITYNMIGHCDMVFPRWPMDVCKMQMMEYRVPGNGIPDDQTAQIVEKEIMKTKDYEFIISEGITPWFFNHIAKIWNINIRFPFCIPLIIPKLILLNIRTKKIKSYWNSKGIPTNFDAAYYPAFDLFSLVRSLDKFFYDLFNCPGLVEEACIKATPDLIKLAKTPLRLNKGKFVCIYPMRSSATFISPDFFERFALPYLKESIQTFYNEGLICILHCDGNWTPMLKFFKNFPHQSCIIELDGETDIFEAKKILGNHLCIKGNVPATLLAFNSKDEVVSYCKRLIKIIGKDNGFILSSGCEVPINAKIENVKAMVETVNL